MAYEIVCLSCSKKYKSIQPHGKFCSNECKVKILRERQGRFSDRSIPGNTVGAITELIVAADLMKKGYDVFRALSPACYCDLIATKDNITLLVEARTGYKGSDGKYFFPTGLRKNANVYGIAIGKSNEIIYFDKDAKTPFIFL